MTTLVTELGFSIDTQTDLLTKATDYIVSHQGKVIGTLTGSLRTTPTITAIVLGQLVIEGTDRGMAGIDPVEINGKAYDINCVYQWVPVDHVELPTQSELGSILQHAIGERSPYAGGVETLLALATGPIESRKCHVEKEVHYVVGDVIFAKQPTA